jgi:hypothetical protein
LARYLPQIICLRRRLNIRSFWKVRLKNELQNIISGNGSVKQGATVEAIARFVGGKKAAVLGAEEAEFDKVQSNSI